MLTAKMKKKVFIIRFMVIVEYVFGIIISFLFINVLIASIFDTEVTLIATFVSITLVLFGVFLIIIATKYSLLINRFCMYIGKLAQFETMSLTALSTATGKSMDFIVKDLENIIKCNLFEDAYIDNLHDCLVMKDNIFADSQIYLNARSSTIIMQCSQCGASNTVYNGSLCECEYCGTQLNVSHI